MATQLLRRLLGHGVRVAQHGYAAARLAQPKVIQAQTVQPIQAQLVRPGSTRAAVRARRRHVKARVGGVKKTTRAVTKGNRQQRAAQLRSYRANPQTRAALRNRVKFYTIP